MLICQINLYFVGDYHSSLKKSKFYFLMRMTKDILYINNLNHIMWSNIDQKLVFSEFAIEIRRFEQYDFVAFMISWSYFVGCTYL